METIARKILGDTHALITSMQSSEFIRTVTAVGAVLQKAAINQNTVFIAGNGGSWADADHFAGELRAQFEVKGRKALPALALPISLSSLTAWGNDYEDGFTAAVTRDLEAMAKPGDVLIAISTSGKAKNIRHALDWAKTHQLTPIGMSGNGPLAHEFGQLVDYHIQIPHQQTARIQEAYQIIIHILCTYIDQVTHHA